MLFIQAHEEKCYLRWRWLSVKGLFLKLMASPSTWIADLYLSPIQLSPKWDSPTPSSSLLGCEGHSKGMNGLRTFLEGEATMQWCFQLKYNLIGFTNGLDSTWTLENPNYSKHILEKNYGRQLRLSVWTSLDLHLWRLSRPPPLTKCLCHQFPEVARTSWLWPCHVHTRNTKGSSGVFFSNFPA